MIHTPLKTGELYIVCQFNALYPYGRMSKVFHSLFEAKDLIRVQKEMFYSDSDWKILHVKESEWIEYKPTPKSQEEILEDLYREEEDEPFWQR